MGSVAGDTPKMAQLRKTAITAIEGYNTWVIDDIMAVRHESAIHEILPSTCFLSLHQHSHLGTNK